MFRTVPTMTALAALSILATAAATAEAAPKRVGGNNTWSAYENGSGDSKICFVHGAPTEKKGNYSKRGDVYIQITHRPGDKIRDEVSVTAGYTYKEDAPVIVNIHGSRFEMFTKGDNGWLSSTDDDGKLVQAMIKGAKMEVRGRSTRNTLTVDTYSLSGFTAAYRAASRACNLPTS